MRKSFITTIDAWRFERPLALALAASTIFMVMAVPPDRLSAFPGLAAFPGFQPVLALIVGVSLGVLGYVAMAYPWPRIAPVAPRPEAPVIPDEDQGQFAASEVSLRLRRADRHPDAPVREPIFASRDLGSPFMEVGAFAATPEPPVDALVPEADFDEIEPAADDDAATPPIAAQEAAEEDAADDGMVADEPVTDDLAAAQDGGADEAGRSDDADATAPEPPYEWPIAPMSSPLAAFAPEEEPAPAPARTQRQSIAAMMDRLSAGIDRRAANGDALPPLDRQPALREALEELNRLAARRG